MDLPNQTSGARADLSSADPPAYWHRQYAPWSWLLYVIAALIPASAVLAGGVAAVWIMLPASLFAGLLASSFHHLTIEDRGSRLSVKFGPTPLFGLSIPYSEIRSVEAGRTSFLDGWGIHYSLRGGWVWNVWGRECVVIRRRRRILRLGSDDAEKLLVFIRSRIRA